MSKLDWIKRKLGWPMQVNVDLEEVDFRGDPAQAVVFKSSKLKRSDIIDVLENQANLTVRHPHENLKSILHVNKNIEIEEIDKKEIKKLLERWEEETDEQN